MIGIKKLTYLLVLLLYFNRLYSLQEEVIIEKICKEKQRFEEALKRYTQIEERNTIILDEKEKVVKEEFILSEIYWNGKEWTRKILKKINKGIVKQPMTIKIEKENNILFPFNSKDKNCFEYNIENTNDKILIKAFLKSNCKGKKALEGEFIISKKSQYIESAFLTISKLFFILEYIKIKITYSKVGEDLIAPEKVETITTSKKIFGVRRIVKTESSFKYLKEDNSLQNGEGGRDSSWKGGKIIDVFEKMSRRYPFSFELPVFEKRNPSKRRQIISNYNLGRACNFGLFFYILRFGTGKNLFYRSKLSQMDYALDEFFWQCKVNLKDEVAFKIGRWLGHSIHPVDP